MRIGLLVLVLCPLTAWAQSSRPGLKDAMHSASYGLAGAYRGVGLGADSVDANPATLALYRRYLLELSGAWDLKNSYGFGSIAVLDSVTQSIAAGASYHLVSMDKGENHKEAHVGTLALTLPFSEVFHAGVSGRWALLKGPVERNGITLDAGLLVRPIQELTVSASGHNLIDVQNPELPRYFTLSGGWTARSFLVTADVDGDFNQSRVRLAYAAGGQYLIADMFPIRLGYRYDTIEDASYLGMGLGFFMEGGGVDIGYRHQLGGLEGRLLSLTLKLQIN